MYRQNLVKPVNKKCRCKFFSGFSSFIANKRKESGEFKSPSGSNRTNSPEIESCFRNKNSNSTCQKFLTSTLFKSYKELPYSLLNRAGYQIGDNLPNNQLKTQVALQLFEYNFLIIISCSY
jgi:hypothetical protein